MHWTNFVVCCWSAAASPFDNTRRRVFHHGIREGKRRQMPTLTDLITYADAQREFSSAGLWALFDGDRSSLNIAHECVDRHAEPGRVALRIAHADGTDET